MKQKKTLAPWLRRKWITIGVPATVIVLLVFFYNNISRAQFSEHARYKQVLTIVKDNYVDPSRINAAKMLVGAVENLSVSVADVYVTDIKQDESVISLRMHVGGKNMMITMKKSGKFSTLIDTLHQVERFVAGNSVESEIRQNLPNYIINGLLNELDPHSNFFNSRVLEKFNQDSKGSFGGIGIYINLKNDDLIVVSPIVDTPAERIGLKARDKIKKINKISTLGMSLNEAISLIKGEIGTSVTLSIMRRGWAETKDFAIRRDKIYNSMDSHVFDLSDKKIGYLRFRRFTKESAVNMSQELRKMNVLSPNFAGLIMDLRNNPGGYLAQAIEIADLFLKKDIIVATGKSANEIEQIYHAKEGNDYTTFPIFVLVNPNSASASEILAAALKKNNRAVVIGNSTFGKGSIQTIYDLKNGTALKLTISQYFTANLNSIQSVGVSPHIAFALIKADPDDFTFIKNTDALKERDLENAFLWGTKIINPLYTINYVKPPDDTPKDDETEYVNGIDMTGLKKDPLFKLAMGTLSNTDRPDDGNYDIVADAIQKAKEQNEQYKQLFVRQLNDQNIEWIDNYDSGAAKFSQIDVHIALKKIRDKKEVSFNPDMDELNNNDNLAIYFSVKNSGNKKRHNVVGLIRSADNRLNNIQIPFGAIKPKTVITKKFVFKSSGKERRRVVPFKISLYSSRTELKKNAESYFIIDGDKQPSYSLAIRAKKNEPDGVGSLSVSIKNISAHYVGEPVFIIRSPLRSDTLHFARTRFTPGALMLGESTSDSIPFTYAKEKFGSDDKDNAVTFLLYDATYKQTVFEYTHRFKNPRDISFDNQPASITLDAYPAQTGNTKVILGGMLTDDKKIKDYFILMNDKKIFYQSANRQTVRIRVPLTLNNHSNNIRLFVRDSEDVYSAKEIYIWSGDIKHVEK